MIWQYERRNQRFKDLNSLTKILVYLWKNVLYCLKCRENTESKNPNVVETKMEE